MAITNHLSREVTLTPTFNAEGAHVRAAPTTLVVPAGATKSATVTLTASTPGPGHLALSAVAPSGPIQATLPFNVIARERLTDAASKVTSVSLEADIFYTGSGNPPITLNGVKVGPLFSEWTPHPFSWYSAGTRFPLDEAAVAAVADTNEVRLDPPDGMLLKVRNLALVVNYEDGRTSVFRADPKVQTAADNASLAEGTYVPRGAIMVWHCPAVR